MNYYIISKDDSTEVVQAVQIKDILNYLDIYGDLCKTSFGKMYKDGNFSIISRDDLIIKLQINRKDYRVVENDYLVKFSKNDYKIFSEYDFNLKCNLFSNFGLYKF